MIPSSSDPVAATTTKTAVEGGVIEQHVSSPYDSCRNQPNIDISLSTTCLKTSEYSNNTISTPTSSAAISNNISSTTTTPLSTKLSLQNLHHHHQPNNNNNLFSSLSISEGNTSPHARNESNNNNNNGGSYAGGAVGGGNIILTLSMPTPNTPNTPKGQTGNNANRQEHEEKAPEDAANDDNLVGNGRKSSGVDVDQPQVLLNKSSSNNSSSFNHNNNEIFGANNNNKQEISKITTNNQQQQEQYVGGGQEQYQQQYQIILVKENQQQQQHVYEKRGSEDQRVSFSSATSDSSSSSTIQPLHLTNNNNSNNNTTTTSESSTSNNNQRSIAKPRLVPIIPIQNIQNHHRGYSPSSSDSSSSSSEEDSGSSDSPKVKTSITTTPTGDKEPSFSSSSSSSALTTNQSNLHLTEYHNHNNRFHNRTPSSPTARLTDDVNTIKLSTISPTSPSSPSVLPWSPHTPPVNKQQQPQQHAHLLTPLPIHKISSPMDSSDEPARLTARTQQPLSQSFSQDVLPLFDDNHVDQLVTHRTSSLNLQASYKGGHINHGHSHDHAIPKIQQRRGQYFPHDQFKIVMTDFTIQITEKNNESIIIEEYTELKSLGTGGQATVFSGLEKTTGERVALKVINAGGNSAQLWNEFNILRVLKHSSIIPVWKLYETKNIFNSMIMITMPVYIHGDMTAFITKFAPKYDTNPFTPHCIIDMVLQITDAIQYTHSKGIIHRDLKPDNIFISSLELDKKNRKLITSCKVTLGDFGLSKNIQQSMAVSVVGTLGWMSPDHLNGNFSLKTDMWSLGCIIYYLISLDAALLNTNDMINENHAAHKVKMRENMYKKMNSTLPSKFVELIDIVVTKLLEKNPEERLSSHEFFWDYLIPWRFRIDETELTEVVPGKEGLYSWNGSTVTLRRVTKDQFKTLIQLRDIQYITKVLGYFTTYDELTDQEEIYILHKPQGTNLKAYLVPSNPRYVSLHDKLEILLKIATAIEEINRTTDIRFIIKLDESKIYIDEQGEVTLSILDAVQVQQQPMEKDNIYNLYFFSLDLLDDCREIYNYPFEESYSMVRKKNSLIDFPRLLVFVFSNSIVTHPSKYSSIYVSQKLYTQLYMNHKFPGDKYAAERKESVTSYPSIHSPNSLSMTPPTENPLGQSPPPSSNIAIITQTMEAEKLTPEEQFHCSHKRIKEMIRANSIRHILKSYHIGRDGNDKKWSKIIIEEEEEGEVQAYEEYSHLQNYHLTSNAHGTDSPVEISGKAKKNPELVHVSIECLNFQPILFRDYFNGKQLEPLYLYWYLIDIKQKRRISETFSCDINSREMRIFLGEDNEDDDPLSVKKSRCAGYEVDSSNSDIMVLFVVTKTLQGSDSMDAYIKPGKSKLSEEKFTKSVNTLFPTLKNYQQVVSWACEPLFDFEGNLILPKEIETFYYMDEVRNEHSFYEFFEKRDVKKEKLVPMTLKLHCELTRAYEATTVSSKAAESLTDLNDQFATLDLKSTSFYLKQTNGNNNGSYMCKMFTFAPNFRSSLTDSNNLYIYPLSTAFKRRLFLKDMNVGIIVKFKRNDRDISDEGEQVFIKKNNKTFKEGFSSVSYQSTSPQFNDELKLQLPEQLGSGDHLLFTFVNVDCAGDEKNVQVVGHSYYMLLGKHGLLATHGNLILPIYKRLTPKSYLQANEDTKKNGEFKVEFQPISTLYTTDINLYEFFSANEVVKVMKSIYGENLAEIQNNISKKLKNLEKVVDFRNLIQYMPQIVDELLLMITLKQFPNVQSGAFGLLNSYLDKLKKTERNTKQYIERYIKEAFVNHPDSTGLLFEQLLKRYVRNLDEEQKMRAEKKGENFNFSVYNFISGGGSHDGFLINMPNDSITIENSSIYFQLIEKSLILYMNNQKLLNQQYGAYSPLRHLSKKKDDVPAPFSQLLDLLSELRTLVVKECKFRYSTSMSVAKLLVSSYAQFLCGLMNLIDRGFIITEIEMFLDEFLPSKDQQFELLQELKNIFLKQISCYDHFLSMCLAYSTSSCLQYVKKNGNYIVYHMCDTHYLSGIFIKRFLLDTLHKQRKVREKAAITFNFLLSRHEYDARFQSKEERQKIASLYFPFIIIICDLWKTYEELTKADSKSLKDTPDKRPEAQTMLINFLHILINTRKKVFRQWWTQEAVERKKQFIKILSSVPKLFKYAHSRNSSADEDEDPYHQHQHPMATPRSSSLKPVSSREQSDGALSPRGKKSGTMKETTGRKSFIFPFASKDDSFDPRKVPLSRFSSPTVNKLSHRTSVSILRSQQSSYSQLFRGDSKKKAKEQQNRWRRILSIQASIATMRIMSWIFEEELYQQQQNARPSSPDDLTSDLSYLKIVLEFFFSHLEVEQSETTYQLVFQLLALFVKNYKIYSYYYSREDLIRKVNEFATRSTVESTKLTALAFTKWVKLQQQLFASLSFSANSVNRQSSYNIKPIDRTKSSGASKFDGILNISDLLWNIKVRYKERQYVEQLKGWLNSQQPDVITAVEYLEKEFVKYMYPDDFTPTTNVNSKAMRVSDNDNDEEDLESVPSEEEGEELSLFQALRLM
ncbi:predicted protein [Naegleria gruberi]|uniref:Predicted protein n=1 Tax=Naegleria gruberi TaxID=5762 RepID=D2VXT8_NAEGR|nr:uncharacterized protein NAEGRDRAFT_81641 [Naegleria gruberi]EFC38348.1 predicted protein [Naegleria gruberi]|eukprot:XP_002671092.1 predicted protein [Naegleria gruberi strain NEG-M]